MAKDETKQRGPEQADGDVAEVAPETVRDRGPLKLLGAVLGTVVVGATLAFMAIPSKSEPERLRGPFPYQILEEPYQANTIDSNATRYVKFTPHCEYYAYEQDYLPKRATDPLYMPELRSALGRAVADKTITDILEGIQRELFAVEVQAEIAPVLFPVHVGDTKYHRDRDELSGLRLGDSFEEATFRGYFHDHELHVDAAARTLRLDDGPETTFSGEEHDLLAQNQSGETLFLDVTDVEEDFQGTVPVGVMGRVRKVLIVDPIAQ